MLQLQVSRTLLSIISITLFEIGNLLILCCPGLGQSGNFNHGYNQLYSSSELLDFSHPFTSGLTSDLIGNSHRILGPVEGSSSHLEQCWIPPHEPPVITSYEPYTHVPQPHDYSNPVSYKRKSGDVLNDLYQGATKLQNIDPSSLENTHAPVHSINGPSSLENTAQYQNLGAGNDYLRHQQVPTGYPGDVPDPFWLYGTQPHYPISFVNGRNILSKSHAQLSSVVQHAPMNPNMDYQSILLANQREHIDVESSNGSSSTAKKNQQEPIREKQLENEVQESEEDGEEKEKEDKSFDPAKTCLLDCVVISKLRFPARYQKPDISLTLINHEKVKSIVIQHLGLTQYTDALVKLMSEMCHRNTALLLIFNHKKDMRQESKDIVQSREASELQKKIVHWAVDQIKQMVLKSDTSEEVEPLTELEKSSPLFQPFLRDYLDKYKENESKLLTKRYMTRKRTVVTRKASKTDALQTALSITILGQYYKSMNLKKWRLIFSCDYALFNLFNYLSRQNFTSLNSLGQRCSAINNLKIFPWEEEPTFLLDHFKYYKISQITHDESYKY